MPWTAKVELDADKTTTGSEVGTVTLTYTAASGTFFATPFAWSVRTEMRAAALSPMRTAALAALAAETQKRTREANRAAAIEGAMNS